MKFQSVSDVARELNVAPRIITDLFYARVLSDDQCPIVAGRRLIPPSYVPVIRDILFGRKPESDG